jgi:hypothetical protein
MLRTRAEMFCNEQKRYFMVPLEHTFHHLPNFRPFHRVTSLVPVSETQRYCICHFKLESPSPLSSTLGSILNAKFTVQKSKAIHQRLALRLRRPSRHIPTFILSFISTFPIPIFSTFSLLSGRVPQPSHQPCDPA